ncbi:uncharacterized protein [Diabrotica undecimpunctata]|uniref:uncharacterized protein isoform X3 n=1 Tax=Diabrotica undecimpunctata TaxID=50387 RepID=UPI003B635CDE
MEVIKQEISEETCKVEIENSELDDGFKCEIKEESDLESTDDTFDCSALKEFPIKTEIEQDGNKLTRLKEKPEIKGGFTQEEKKIKVLETFLEHSSHKRQSRHADKKIVISKTNTKWIL